MKTSNFYKKIIFFLILLFVSVTGAYAQDEYSAVKLNGKLLIEGVELTQADVILFDGERMIDSGVTSASGKFSFILPLGYSYQILIEKAGYERRILKVNSSMLSKMDQLKNFEFTIDMKKKDNNQLADK